MAALEAARNAAAVAAIPGGVRRSTWWRSISIDCCRSRCNSGGREAACSNICCTTGAGAAVAAIPGGVRRVGKAHGICQRDSRSRCNSGGREAAKLPGGKTPAKWPQSLQFRGA